MDDALAPTTEYLCSVLEASGHQVPVRLRYNHVPEDRLHTAYVCCTLPCTEELQARLITDRLNQGHRMMSPIG